MSQGMVEQVLHEWMSAYVKEHLKEFEGETLDEEQRWCEWLKKELPSLRARFQQYLVVTGRFPASAHTLERAWEQWVADDMLFLVDKFRDETA